MRETEGTLEATWPPETVWRSRLPPALLNCEVGIVNQEMATLWTIPSSKAIRTD